MENTGTGVYEEKMKTLSPQEVATTLSLTTPIKWANSSKNILHSGGFTRAAKVWLLFVNTNILPTKHLNHVSYPRAVLIYCILKGIKFNTGEIVAKQLRDRAANKAGLQLWFPTMITAFCRFAGISERNEMVTQVGHHITERVIRSNIKVSYKKKSSHEPTKL